VNALHPQSFQCAGFVHFRYNNSPESCLIIALRAIMYPQAPIRRPRPGTVGSDRGVPAPVADAPLEHAFYPEDIDPPTLHGCDTPAR